MYKLKNLSTFIAYNAIKYFYQVICTKGKDQLGFSKIFWYFEPYVIKLKSMILKRDLFIFVNHINMKLIFRINYLNLDVSDYELEEVEKGLNYSSDVDTAYKIIHSRSYVDVLFSIAESYNNKQ